MVNENEPDGECEAPKYNGRCSLFSNEKGNWVWLNMQEVWGSEGKM